MHSDLMNRAKILCLALKGALGRKGTGYQACGWVGLDGFSNAMQMEREGITGRLGALLGTMPPAMLFQSILDLDAKRKTQNDVERTARTTSTRRTACARPTWST
jgi:hypothetical protein